MRANRVPAVHDPRLHRRKDATLRELADLIKEEKPAAMRRDARLNFAFVYPDKRGVNVMKSVGMTQNNRPGACLPSTQVAVPYLIDGLAGEDDDKTLNDLKFQTGDFLAVAIH